MASDLQKQLELNEACYGYCTLLKEIAVPPRQEEVALIKTLGISKSKHTQRADLEIEVNSPMTEKNLGSGDPPPPELIEHYKEVFTKGWENFTYRELTHEQKM